MLKLIFRFDHLRFLIRLFTWPNSIDICFGFCFCFCFTFYSCLRMCVSVRIQFERFDWRKSRWSFICVRVLYKPVVTVSWRSNHKHVLHKHTHTEPRIHKHVRTHNRYSVYWRSLCLQFLVCCTCTKLGKRAREAARELKIELLVSCCFALCVRAFFSTFNTFAPLSR